MAYVGYWSRTVAFDILSFMSFFIQCLSVSAKYRLDNRRYPQEQAKRSKIFVFCDIEGERDGEEDRFRDVEWGRQRQLCEWRQVEI